MNGCPLSVYRSARTNVSFWVLSAAKRPRGWRPWCAIHFTFQVSAFGRFGLSAVLDRKANERNDQPVMKDSLNSGRFIQTTEFNLRVERMRCTGGGECEVSTHPPPRVRGDLPARRAASVRRDSACIGLQVGPVREQALVSMMGADVVSDEQLSVALGATADRPLAGEAVARARVTRWMRSFSC